MESNALDMGIRGHKLAHSTLRLQKSRALARIIETINCHMLNLGKFSKNLKSARGPCAKHSATLTMRVLRVEKVFNHENMRRTYPTENKA